MKKQDVWEQYPQVWGLFVDFNQITQEDEEAWHRLVEEAHRIDREHDLLAVRNMLTEVVGELDLISRKRRERSR